MDSSGFHITRACSRHLQSVSHKVEQVEEAERSQTDQNPRQPPAFQKGGVTSLRRTIFAQVEEIFGKTKESPTPIGVATLDKECSIKVWLIRYGRCIAGWSLA